MNLPKQGIFALIIGITLGCSPPTSAQTRVITENGEVEGKLINGLRIFKGIPYAKPPVGNLRWRAPQLPQKQNGILRAYEYGADCPQKSQLAPNQKEDCLFLNIWAPVDAN